MHNNCIFCKIILKQVPSEIIKETENIIVIKDIAPKAPIHYLIIPKKHFPDLNAAQKSDIDLLGNLLYMAKILSEEFSIPYFRLIVNNGKEAGQCVFHFHIHFLSGKHLGGF